VLLSEGLLKGSRLFSGPQKVFLDDCKEGSTQKLLNINLFDSINSIELFPLSGFKLLRSAGVSSKIISKDNEKSVLKLPSGWQISLPNHAMAVFGVVSNLSYCYNVLRKAGVNRKRVFVLLLEGLLKILVIILMGVEKVEVLHL
jgi:large subunit ribosomal protein L2